MLEHGGQLRAAAQRYGIALGDWLDLSTGINPQPYPIPPIDPACWQRRPEDGDGLEATAAHYYGNERLLVLAGSQAAAAALPKLFAPAAVACLAPMAEEHAQAWARAGHRVRRLPTLQRALAGATPNVVLGNPNNPTATTLPRSVVLDAAAELERRGGWLIVDEGFADADPDNCVAALAGSAQAPRLIVLRSLSNFFGLAGARVGFVFGAPEKLARLREILGPWPVSNASRAVAREALQDAAWQHAARERLAASAPRLAALLAALGEVSQSALFCTLTSAHAAALYEHFARRAILTHAPDGPQPSLLRFGLPGSAADWQRLTQAIAEWKTTC